MRATTIRLAIIANFLLPLAGCRSGTSYSPWNWGWGRKTAGSESVPQLPSANATPPNYGSTVQNSVAPSYPDTGPNAYQPASYPSQPAGYTNAGSASMPNAAAANPYPQMPNAAPQAGPYADNYGPPAVASAAGSVTAGTPYPTTDARAAAPSGTPYGPSSDPYAATAAAGAGGVPAADEYPASNPAGAADRYANRADSRDATSPYPSQAAQPEQAVAQGYLPTGVQPSQPPAADGSYQPGTSSYTPGQTGYSPPGVAPYQMPATPNVVASERRDPYYRPGGTSDYLPSGGVGSPASPPQAGDRYATPPIGPQSDPYAPAATPYQVPSGQ